MAFGQLGLGSGWPQQGSAPQPAPVIPMQMPDMSGSLSAMLQSLGSNNAFDQQQQLSKGGSGQGSMNFLDFLKAFGGGGGGGGAGAADGAELFA